MTQQVARAAIDQLLAEYSRRTSHHWLHRRRTVPQSGPAHLGRGVCGSPWRETGSRVGFSVTTNGTLLTSEDLDFLRTHSFAISVSLDGGAEVNDQRTERSRKKCVRTCRAAAGAFAPEPGQYPDRSAGHRHPSRSTRTGTHRSAACCGVSRSGSQSFANQPGWGVGPGQRGLAGLSRRDGAGGGSRVGTIATSRQAPVLESGECLKAIACRVLQAPALRFRCQLCFCQRTRRILYMPSHS